MAKYTLDQVRELLGTNQAWVERAIVVLYEHQTADEQASESTNHSNNVGFQACDAKTFSYQARWIKSGRHLTGKHLEKAFKRIPKYARQVLRLIEAKADATKAQPAVEPTGAQFEGEGGSEKSYKNNPTYKAWASGELQDEYIDELVHACGIPVEEVFKAM